MASTPLTSKEMLLQAAEMLQEAFKGHPRWLVELDDPPRVTRLRLSVENSPEYHAGGTRYFVRAQDELEAFMKARKMEERRNAQGHIQV